MHPILIASTAPYSGKSGLALSVAGALSDRGIDAGYFKPYGAMPVTVDGVLTDQDAAYINRMLRVPAPLEAVCPVVRTEALIQDVLSHKEGDLIGVVRNAYAACAKGREAMVVEGPSDLEQASAVGLSVADVASLLDAHVLLVHRPSSTPDLPDPVICEVRHLAGRLAGVVLNWVQESQWEFTTSRVVPFLESRGIRVFGTIPADAALSSVSVQEIVDALGGTVLCADDQLQEPVEAFMVGAMGQDKALRFFRRKARKAVITGGDRADVQLAALETNTRALILTGNMPPSSLVLARAEEMGVPMVLVDTDTLTAVEKMEALMGHTRLHDAGKAARIRQMFESAVNVDDLIACMRHE
ncbi:MAG: phosphotransacetylase family protein [Coriobacteriales bacterium]|nr:phosphotransacetylase family protein [Actinomycetes bacterium]